jgi:maltose-binding protein MalE
MRPFLIFISFIILLFSGCGDSGGKKMIVWSSLRPVERELLQQKLDEFGKRYPGYKFIQLFYAPEELRTNFIISSLAGRGPGLVHCASDLIGPFSELEVIKPLNDFFSPAFLDSFIAEPFQANTTFRGNLYQVADRVGNHLTLVYNKNMVPKPPETISELITVGQEIVTDEDGDGTPERYALAWNYTEPFFAVPFIGMYGGWILDENYQPTLNTPAVVQAAQLIYDLAHKYKIIPKESDYETANALFLDGKSAMIINGPWSWGTYLKRGMNIGLSRIPRNEETGQWATPIVSPLGYVANVNLQGEELAVAIELIRYLTSPEVQLAFAFEFNLIPSRKDLINNPELEKNELYRAAVDQMIVGKPMPVITELRWIWDAMRPAYQGIFTNQISPKEAAEEMQKLAEKLIAENRD